MHPEPFSRKLGQAAIGGREQVSEPVAWSAGETAAFMARDRAGLSQLVAKTGIKLTE